MPKIMAIPDGMRNMAERIYSSSENLNNNRRDMEKIFRDFGRCFSGKIPEILLQRVMHMENSYRRFTSTLYKYGRFLNDMANRYELADEGWANMINAHLMKNNEASNLLKLKNVGSN